MSDMNDLPNETVPLDLQRFVSAEVARPSDEAGKDLIRERLAVSLGIPLAAPSAASPSRVATQASSGLQWAPGWAKAAILLAVGFGAGFGSHVALVSPSSPNASPRAPSASPTGTAKALGTEASSVVDSIDIANLPSVPQNPVVLPSAGTSGSSKATTKGSTAEDAEAERLLLETARVALRRGDREGALSLLEQHKRRFPHGQLREERDGLTVSALSQLGRSDEAAKAAARFRKDYPMSLQGAGMPSAIPTATP